jgi:hypothetical protein
MSMVRWGMAAHSSTSTSFLWAPLVLLAVVFKNKINFIFTSERLNLLFFHSLYGLQSSENQKTSNKPCQEGVMNFSFTFFPIFHPFLEDKPYQKGVKNFSLIFHPFLVVLKPVYIPINSKIRTS